MTTMSRHILHLRFDLPADHDADLPERLRSLLENITPRVQMIDPDVAVLDLTGALPYWRRDARSLTEVIQLRLLAYFGLRSAAGCVGNRILASMACALTPARPARPAPPPTAWPVALRVRPGPHAAR
ncbi:hypothetical protein ACIHJG_39725 [Streptomyces sp. NPDC052415]|uniref:hypothetical protein n=1 Tax=Streptomyces sp. NPDC052415 TaxID=3365690 RepID=UPI0037CDDF24